MKFKSSSMVIASLFGAGIFLASSVSAVEEPITPWKSSMPRLISVFEILKGLLIALFVLPTILLLLALVGMWLLWVIDPSHDCPALYPYDYLTGDCS